MALSRKVVYGSLAVLVATTVWWLGQEPEVKPTVRKPAAKQTKQSAPSVYLPIDYTARFDKPKQKPRNLFVPLFLTARAEQAEEASEEEGVDLIKIPADLAEGDGAWGFTGFVIVDDKRMALLENGTTKKGEYVREGQAWKTSTIRKIASESLTLTNKEGVDTVILRHNANVKKKTPDGPTEPANPRPVDLSGVLKGPIGPQNIRIVPSPPPPMPMGGTVILD